jgi:hypothetical protein
MGVGIMWTIQRSIDGGETWTTIYTGEITAVSDIYRYNDTLTDYGNVCYRVSEDGITWSNTACLTAALSLYTPDPAPEDRANVGIIPLRARVFAPGSGDIDLTITVSDNPDYTDASIYERTVTDGERAEAEHPVTVPGRIYVKLEAQAPSETIATELSHADNLSLGTLTGLQVVGGKLVIPPPPPPDDPSGSPGANMLVAGDMTAGYFGTVTSAQLITGDALCSAIGLSVGTSQYSNTDWLKFAYKGKIQFVAMKPIRHTLSWDDINAAGAIYGKNITIGGLTYKVRSFRGAEHDPTNSYADPDKDAIGSEWNDLMLPLHERAATGSWAYPEYAGTVPNWGIGFTGADLLTHYSYGSGSSTWCQEVQDTNTDRRINRGYNEIAYSRGTRASTVSAIYGFRPVLELEES